jgi:hypothetical protein
MFTWIKHKLTPPSRYGLSDFYYDGMLIRVPYRKGTVWKWYAYWGSLVLERTEWAPRFFAWPRTVATDWITEPNINSSEPNGGHVHLGFWSLWASPEGFAGFDRQGHVSSEDSIITSVKQALASIKPDNVDIEVYVVGHSLGGAVSRYASLSFLHLLSGVLLIRILVSPHLILPKSWKNTRLRECTTLLSAHRLLGRPNSQDTFVHK